MNKPTFLSALAVLMSVCAAPAVAGGPTPTQVSVAGEKLDSGLGSLPHYSRWTSVSGKALVGEKLDSGLGELPHYSQWADTTGRARVAKQAHGDKGESVQFSRLK